MSKFVLKVNLKVNFIDRLENTDHLTFGIGLAIDPLAKNIYVLDDHDDQNQRIQKYRQDSSFVKEWKLNDYRNITSGIWNSIALVSLVLVLLLLLLLVLLLGDPDELAITFSFTRSIPVGIT